MDFNQSKKLFLIFLKFFQKKEGFLDIGVVYIFDIKNKRINL